MQIAQALAGFSAGEADILRRAMGKKKRAELEKQKERFVNGAIQNGIKKDLANYIFTKIEPFAEYGFNKSHAAAYALIAYQTAYLKTYYKEEFIASTMSTETTNTSKLREFVDELKRLKVEEDKRNPNEYLGDAYLGDVSTVSKKANIVCRDFEYMDGDRVSILVNDEVIVENLTLTYEFRGINLKLKEGFNKIDFVALNQGSSGPNTAELRIYDDSENLLSANQWNLATGSTATLIIVKK